MNFKACPSCGQIPTAYFDFTKPAAMAQHTCATASGTPPLRAGMTVSVGGVQMTLHDPQPGT